jgi:transcriptional regulator with XRE-family HTH domain
MVLRNADDLAKLMRLKGLSIRTLAEQAQVSRSTIWRIRRLHPASTHLDTATAIAEALNVRVDALFRPASRNGPSRGAEPEVAATP